MGDEFLFMWQLSISVGKKDCASFVLTSSDSEVQVIDNSTTVLARISHRRGHHSDFGQDVEHKTDEEVWAG